MRFSLYAGDGGGDLRFKPEKPGIGTVVPEKGAPNSWQPPSSKRFADIFGFSEPPVRVRDAFIGTPSDDAVEETPSNEDDGDDDDDDDDGDDGRITRRDRRNDGHDDGDDDDDCSNDSKDTEPNTPVVSSSSDEEKNEAGQKEPGPESFESDGRSAFIVEKCLEMPDLPDTDSTTVSTKTPEGFGRTKRDAAWNSFATRFYRQLKTVSRTVNYWYDLIVAHHEKWEVVAKECDARLEGKLDDDDGDNDDDDDDDDDDDRGSDYFREHNESCFPGFYLHRSRPKCALLDPFDLATGHHFCYFYWLKLMIAASYSYGRLNLYFLGACTVQNFSKVVRLEGTRDFKSGTYRPNHQTSMQRALCIELNRLRLVAASARLWPLTPEAHLYHLHERTACADYARDRGYLRSQTDRPCPVMPTASLYISSPTGGALAKVCAGAQASSADCRREKEVKRKADARLHALTCERSKLPLTAVQELLNGVTWRAGICWHTRSYHRYLSLIADKLSLYYSGPCPASVANDPIFRSKPRDPAGLLDPLRKKLEALVLSSSSSSPSLPPRVGEDDRGDAKMQRCKEIMKALETRLEGCNSFVINSHFAYYTSVFLKDLGTRSYYRCKYPRERLQFEGKDDAEKSFKKEFFLALRTFLKIWCRHRRVSNTDMLRDTAGTKYPRSILTNAEYEWYKYYSHHVLKDPSKLTSTAASKLLKTLRPYEHESLTDVAGQNMDVLFEIHRTDPTHRGYADWLRLLLAGSAFASIPEFTGELSKYVLHQDQTLSCGTWFDLPDFPFLWYDGGRYHVYCNKKVWHVFDHSQDLMAYVEKKHFSVARGYLDERWLKPGSFSSGDGGDPQAAEKAEAALKKALANDARLVNKQNDFDDHVYFDLEEEDLDGIKRELHRRLFPARVAESSAGPPRTGQPGGDDVDVGDADDSHSFRSWDGWLEAGTEALREAQSYCFPEPSADDGDTLYDTLALWACAVQENNLRDPLLAKAVRHAISESCSNLLDKAIRGAQTDVALAQATPQVEKMKRLVEEYEEKYI